MLLNWEGAQLGLILPCSILSYICSGFCVFQSGGWGTAAPKGWGLQGIQPPLLYITVTYSLYIIAIVKFLLCSIHILQ